MADRFDVAERLADGRFAAEHIQCYVQACRALGYREPDLTARPSQILDWYDSEQGLDLHALDRDCAQLRAAGAAVAEALRIQRAQVDELAAAWTGPGGAAAIAFLRRHCDAADTVTTEVRAAAQRCESLRDNLWYLLDSKVATTVAIDDRTQAQRPAWLTAAAAATHGAGDPASVEQVVRHEINPYVDNDIRNDWLTAMRSSMAGIAAAYDMVIDRMAVAPVAYFEVPGDFGPAYQPDPPAAVAPAAVVPAAVASLGPTDPSLPPAPAGAPPPPPAPAGAPPPPPVPAGPPPPPPVPAGPPPAAATAPLAQDWGAALGDAAGMPAGGLGGDLGGLGGLSGLAGRIVDAMGGLLGSAGRLGDPAALDDALSAADDPGGDAPFRPVGRDQNADEQSPGDDVEDVGQTDQDDQSQPGDQSQPDDQSQPVDALAPVAAPGPVAPPGDAEPAVDQASTPCEIAADQLPQAGQ
ncbi:hypothetical protein [Mycobacterium sp. Lab-001]|uniref:hypothetical protein n=1 Tax=Mycobacterium sp. Lab-001 TaxID=3410136 RepID=UPI003D164FD4